MRPLPARIAGAFAVAAFVGCASAPPPEQAAPAPRNDRVFLVCAPNTVLSLPSELQEGTAPLRSEIEAYLRAHGKQVESVDLFESREAWNLALAHAKQAGEIEQTPVHFVEELARERSFDVLVMPSLLAHVAPARQGRARWDGVERKLSIAGDARHRASRRFTAFLAQLPVTSLHLMLFSRDGERLLESRGGLEITYELAPEPEGARRRGLMLRPRTDLFQDSDTLREGIGVAFDPYLPRLPAAGSP